MKITFLLTTADAVGGTERAAFNQASELAERHDVRVLSVFKSTSEQFFTPDTRVRVDYLVDLTSEVPRPLRPTSVEDSVWYELASQPSQVVDRSWEPIFNRLSDLELDLALQDTDTDILISTTPALMALAVRYAPGHVITVHQEHRVSELRGPTGEPLRRYAAQLDALAVLSERTLEWFAETLGDAAPRLEVVPNALPSGFRPCSTLQTRTVVIAGRLVAEKQIDHAVTAWAKVAEHHPDWQLRIFGDGPLSGALRRQIDILGLHDCVQLNSNSRHLAEEWAKASIATLTSRSEAFGLVLAEAHAAGVPVVSYDSPNGPREVVIDGQTGILVPLGDTDALASALMLLIEDTELRRRMGAAALASVDRFSPAVVTAQWERVFHELVVERDSGGRATAKAERQAVHAYHGGSDGIVPAAVPTPATMVRSTEHQAAEERLLQRPDLIRDGGQVCRLLDWESPWDVVQRNLALAVNALEAAAIPHVVVRDHMIRHTVAVHAGQRDAVFKALAATHADNAVYASVLNEGQKTVATVLAGLVLPFADPTVSGVRIHQNLVSQSRLLRLGTVYGCTISFWETDPEDEKWLRTPVRTLIGDRVPESALRRRALSLGGRAYPSIEPFTRNLHGDVTFPVDVVYTWVNGGDVAWLERKSAVLASLGMETEDSATSAARFRDRDELRYSLRSIDMYAPWIRNIYIITDQQIPNWLDTDHPRVRVVDHKEIFGDRGALPTYNSHAIESQMHHIEGLAEHFLYFNDDMFIGRTLRPDHFFLGSGQAKHFMSPTAIPMSPVSEEDEFNIAGAKNNRELIERDFGQTLVNGFLHAPYPLRRSVLEEITDRYQEEAASTATHQLRSHSDISIPSSLHHYYGYHTLRSVPGSISCGFVNVGLSEHKARLSRILAARPHDVFCLNDYHDGDVTEDEQDAILAAFLPSYFPVPSQFESGSTRNERARLGYLPEWPL
ncbi:stealth conserved region 3 domain-containing protein [Streptomyces rhizosphaerihabitans]|uniref:stealth conserved region 3 domain-containing protein n=1 Tax=Streptomyces rhizosphaerihabitans TaxID=1266770 RepID=UPI0021C039B4|nr:stealth conserved region 3 domain-containing protein [Streptomyces rhizosphaerihabitans]MCT9006022.1 stealth conserved region 3 domain-containing protein [Streptomyces rhizosphaerihabitans]